METSHILDGAMAVVDYWEFMICRRCSKEITNGNLVQSVRGNAHMACSGETAIGAMPSRINASSEHPEYEWYNQLESDSGYKVCSCGKILTNLRMIDWHYAHSANLN